MGKPENLFDNHVQSCYYAVVYNVKSSATIIQLTKIRQLHPGIETGLGSLKCVAGSQGQLCSVPRGQSAMDTRKASTSSIASSIAYSYFSIETSEEEPQQSGTTGL